MITLFLTNRILNTSHYAISIVLQCTVIRGVIRVNLSFRIVKVRFEKARGIVPHLRMDRTVLYIYCVVYRRDCERMVVGRFLQSFSFFSPEYLMGHLISIVKWVLEFRGSVREHTQKKKNNKNNPVLEIRQMRTNSGVFNSA